MDPIRCYLSEDGRRKLEIFRKPTGLFQFEESVVELVVEPDPDFYEEGTTYWNCTHLSGLYESLEAADDDAKSSLAWLRNGNFDQK